ncbi:hypothetical protein WS94_15015 [Burkholderia territorii]|nr:hypothetical protein WS94_15015 [Burkholderia territorii]
MAAIWLIEPARVRVVQVAQRVDYGDCRFRHADREVDRATRRDVDDRRHLGAERPTVHRLLDFGVERTRVDAR